MSIETDALKICVNCGKETSYEVIASLHFAVMVTPKAPLKCKKCGKKCCAQCMWDDENQFSPCSNGPSHQFIEDS